MVFYKYHGCGNDFVLIDEIKNADYRSLADRLCFADGNLENVIATGHACDDQLVIRDEHGVGVVIASVKPLLNIAFNRIHTNNIGREIKIAQKVIAMRVLRKVEVAHGDVRTAGAEHHFPVSKTRGADLSVPYLILNPHFLFGRRKVMVGSLFHADRICFKGADGIRHDENCLFRQPNSAFNAAHCQGKVRLPRCLISHILSRQPTSTPLHHVGIQRLGNEHAPPVTACSGTALVFIASYCTFFQIYKTSVFAVERYHRQAFEPLIAAVRHFAVCTMLFKSILP